MFGSLFVTEHSRRTPFRGKDKMKICLDVWRQIIIIIVRRGMNLSMSVAGVVYACLHSIETLDRVIIAAHTHRSRWRNNDR